MTAEKTDETKTPKAAPKRAAEGEATYVVQMQRTGEFDAGDGKMDLVLVVWVDIATVALPARAHRRSAIAKAFAEAGVKPSAVREACDDPLLVRVLDAASATVTEVPVEVPEPRFVI